jgi:hypothetical protein
MALLQFVDSHFGAFIGFAYTCVVLHVAHRVVNIICDATVEMNKTIHRRM